MNLFPNALHVARREYLQRVRSRTFLIVTIILLLIGLAIPMAPVAFRLIAGDQAKSVEVSLPSGAPPQALGQLQATLNAGGSGGNAESPRYQLTETSDVAGARQRVDQGKL
ncbi:MAG TPA: hypothetical protein VFM74_06275, partial [Candidatus Limnocylindria bacterium]|nr:hypothetical protein [Candidatus Limnocylindria bacterium]